MLEYYFIMELNRGRKRPHTSLGSRFTIAAIDMLNKFFYDI